LKTTQWHVITGAPCSGKTTVIKKLEDNGFQVVHETARAYIDTELKKGKSIEEIKRNELSFEWHILNKKVAIENRLPLTDTVFLDRAVPDSIAYYRLSGLDPSVPIKFSRRFHYRSIFLFDRLIFETDAVRSENDRIAVRLEKLLEDSYKMIGYPIIRVPLMSVSARVDYLLSKIQVKTNKSRF